MKSVIIEEWLNELNLKQHLEKFIKNDINENNLYTLTDNDLKDLKIDSIGDRKLILLSLDKLYSFKRKKYFNWINQSLIIITLISTIILVVVAIFTIRISYKNIELSSNSVLEMQRQIELTYKPDIILEECKWNFLHSRTGIGRWHYYYTDSIVDVNSFKKVFENNFEDNINVPHKIPVKNIGQFAARDIWLEMHPVANKDELKNIVLIKNIEIDFGKFITPIIELNFQTSLNANLKKVTNDSLNIYFSHFQYISTNDDIKYINMPKEIHEYLYILMMIKSNKSDIPEWVVNIPSIWNLSPKILIKITYRNMFNKKYSQYYETIFKISLATGPGGYRTDGVIELDRDHQYVFDFEVNNLDSLSFRKLLKESSQIRN